MTGVIPCIGTTGLLRWDGHLIGGGMGTTGSFTAGRVGGSTKVEMSNGTVLGSVYGGGIVARIGVDENGGFESYITNQVYDSLHHGLTKVEISGGTIGTTNGLALLTSANNSGNIYGGGCGDINDFREDDWGRSANAFVNITGGPTIYGSVFGGGQMANVGHWNNYTDWYTEGTGTTRVTINGTPKIGTELEFNQHYAETPQYTQYDTINGVRKINHTRTGNVYGGGEGNVKFDDDEFVVGLEHGHCRTTEVNINLADEGRIRSCVFGGSKEGAVWGDTKVNIFNGEIGTEGIAADSVQYGNNQNYTHATYSFGNVYGGSYGEDIFTDLHYNGNVQTKIDSVNLLSGRIYGNTEVNISGGTIIRGNVYGGGDMASVYNVTDNGSIENGTCTVNISGSTLIGPLDGTGFNGYVFGGGRGIGEDPLEKRKTHTNVNNTKVTISDGIVSASLFGGSADGHVLSDAEVEIQGGTIGTSGMALGDGNVFGGGGNMLKGNYTAGRVGGNTKITMSDGLVKASVYGGGRMALTGIDVNGEMYTTNSDDHGNTLVSISGGTVGNVDFMETFTSSSMGDVYGGGMGDMEGLTGHPAVSALLIALVKNAEVEITGTARIYGKVYGGGEVANVGDYRWTQASTNTPISDIHLES